MILWNYFSHNLNLSKHISIPKTKLLSKRTVIEVLYNSWFNESLLLFRNPFFSSIKVQGNLKGVVQCSRPP